MEKILDKLEQFGWAYDKEEFRLIGTPYTIFHKIQCGAVMRFNKSSSRYVLTTNSGIKVPNRKSVYVTLDEIKLFNQLAKGYNNNKN